MKQYIIIIYKLKYIKLIKSSNIEQIKMCQILKSIDRQTVII